MRHTFHSVWKRTSTPNRYHSRCSRKGMSPQTPNNSHAEIYPSVQTNRKTMISNLNRTPRSNLNRKYSCTNHTWTSMVPNLNCGYHGQVRRFVFSYPSSVVNSERLANDTRDVSVHLDHRKLRKALPSMGNITALGETGGLV